MNYHFIGICGAGMSAVAKLVKEKGHTVTGSDEGFYPPVSDYLLRNNILCTTPYKKENIPKDVDIIVIGKHAKLTKEDNEEVREAFTLNKKIESFPEVLRDMTKDRERVVVAGSFGKSSCTSLLSWILLENTIDTGYFIGAVPITPQENSHLGTSKEFIFEGDEYPSLNWDITSKFLYYNPKYLLLTALAHDHVNVFPTHDDYLNPFFNLIQKVDVEGIICLSTDDITISKNLITIERLHKNIITYGLHCNPTWSATNIVYGDVTTFTLTKHAEPILTITTTLLGSHNIQNIIGVSALLLETKKVTKDGIAKAIASFKGIVRRLDKKSEKTSIPIYEGFGSSFDKARSAIEAIRLHFSQRKLYILFEPHTFSWRNKEALYWYDTVFSEANTVVIYKPPEHGADTHQQLSLEEIVGRVRATGVTTISANNKEDAKQAFSYIDEKTVVLILSSGSMDGLIQTITDYLENKFPH